MHVSLSHSIYRISVSGTGDTGVSKTNRLLAFSEPTSSEREKTMKKVFFSSEGKCMEGKDGII